MSLAPALAWTDRAARIEFWSWHLLDPDGGELGEVHPDNRGLSMSVDGNANIARSVRGFTLHGDEATDVDPISSRVQPRLTIGEVAYNLGVLLFADAERPRGTRPATLSATLVDQSVILAGDIAHAVGFAQGHLVTDAIAEIASLYPIATDITGSTAQLPGTVGWPPGTSAQRILADLCDAAGYLPLYFDNDGIGIARPMDAVVVNHTYGPDTIVWADSTADSEDLLAAYNTFIVAGGSGDNPAVGVYELPASSPQSVAARGFPVTYTDGNAAVGTAAEARALAAQLAETIGLGYRTATLTTTPNPTHDVFDLIDLEGDTFLETGWRLDCTPGGAHVHTLTRVEDPAADS